MENGGLLQWQHHQEVRPDEVQIPQPVMGNGGLYDGGSTSRPTQMNTQMAQTVMDNGCLYNGNSTSNRLNQRSREIFKRLLSTTGEGRSDARPDTANYDGELEPCWLLVVGSW